MFRKRVEDRMLERQRDVIFDQVNYLNMQALGHVCRYFTNLR